MVSALRRFGATILFCLVIVASAHADDVPSIVVSPYFVPTSIQRAGSSISVISRDQIERSSAGTLADLLRSVPGVTVMESGGAGGQALVYLRGAEPQHTLVMIDGIRVNDVSSARDEYDFAGFSATDIERIEILRGPQSALYGSDAIGGVINIITRRPPSGGPRASLTLEGGSYGTFRSTLSAAQTVGRFSLSGSGTFFRTDGFSRVGDASHDEADGAEKFAGNIRGSVDLGESRKLEFGIDGYQSNADIDGAAPNPSGSCPSDSVCFANKVTTAANAPNTSDRTVLNAFGRYSFVTLDGRLQNALTFLTTNTRRVLDQLNSGTLNHYDYKGSDVGAEYQGVLTLERGSILVGGNLHMQKASNVNDDAASPDFDKTRSLFAGYLLYQVPVGERLNLSFAGRYDGQFGGDGFTTGRATAVYAIPETETRFHGSIGTGAKLPTAFELSYNSALQVEKSVGADVGVSQTLFDGRLTLDVTGFTNRFTNLIDFDIVNNTYNNIKNSKTEGVEVSATAKVIPGKLTATGAYTYLFSENLDTGYPLQRRPRNAGKVSVTWSGIPNLDLTATATFVGSRNNNDAKSTSAPVVLPAYTKVDLAASYRVNDTLSAFARVENLFNAHYQEVSGYNTAGLSAYVGLTWHN